MSETTSRLGHCTTTLGGHSYVCDRDGTFCSQISSHEGPCTPHGTAALELAAMRAAEQAARPSKLEQIAAAQRMRAEGASLFEIARTLGVSKEWLREYAI